MNALSPLRPLRLCVPTLCVLLFALCFSACDNPFRDDGEEAAAIAAPTQAVNQTSYDFQLDAGGDIYFAYDDGTIVYRPVRYAPQPEPEPAPPTNTTEEAP